MRIPFSLKLLVAAAAFLILLIVGLSILSGSGSKETVTISYKNINSVMVYDISETQDLGDKELIAEITESGQSLSLNKDRGYTVTYKGADGYESGDIPFDVSAGKKTININPYFSESKLASLLASELGAVQQILTQSYPQISQYQIQPGKLYQWGDWYGTTLKYIGGDELNSDTLRVVLHKESGVWKVKTDPPDISLSKIIYPDVPRDVLSDVNNFQ